MNDLERRLGQLVGTIDRPDVAGLERRASARRAARHRRVGSLAVVLIAVTGVVGVAAWQMAQDDGPVLTEVGTTDPTPTTDPNPTTNPSPTTEPSEDDAPIRYPVLDHDICERTVERFSPTDRDLPDERPTRIYIETSPISVQIVGTRDELPDRYAVILRVLDGVRQDAWQPRVFETGVGHARIDLGDGTWLYLRTRGLSLTEVESIVAALEPRPLTAAIPGVDLATTAGVEILAEAPELVWVDARSSTCQIDSSRPMGPQIHVAVWSGPMASDYAGAIDAPPPIYMREQSDGSLLILWGASALIDASMLDDVVEGDR